MNRYKIIAFFFLCFSFSIFGQKKEISFESVQSLFIEITFNNRSLGTATGFVIKSKTQYYLITNWHVVTNKNAWNKSWIDPDVPISPNRIGIF